MLIHSVQLLASGVFLLSVLYGSFLLDLSSVYSLLATAWTLLFESRYAMCLQLWCLPPLLPLWSGYSSGIATRVKNRFWAKRKTPFYPICGNATRIAFLANTTEGQAIYWAESNQNGTNHNAINLKNFLKFLNLKAAHLELRRSACRWCGLCAASPARERIAGPAAARQRH